MNRRLFVVRSPIQALLACAAVSELQADQTTDELWLLDCFEPSVERDLFDQLLKRLHPDWNQVHWISKREINAIGRWRGVAWSWSASKMRQKLGLDGVETVVFQESRSTVSKTVQLAFQDKRLVTLGDGAGFELTPLWLRVLKLFSSSPLRKRSLRKWFSWLILDYRKCSTLRPADESYLIASRSGPTADLDHVRNKLTEASVFLADHMAGLLTKLDKALASHSQVHLVLTTPLSEEHVMTPQEEVAAYRAVVESLPESTSLVLLKHHPREDPSKRESLRKALRESGATVMLLDDVLRGFPVEVFIPAIQRLCHQHACDLSCRAFGTLAVTIETLFDCPVSIGFGDETAERYLGPASRKRWNEMRDALQALRAEFLLASPQAD